MWVTISLIGFTFAVTTQNLRKFIKAMMNAIFAKLRETFCQEAIQKNANYSAVLLQKTYRSHLANLTIKRMKLREKLLEIDLLYRKRLLATDKIRSVCSKYIFLCRRERITLHDASKLIQDKFRSYKVRKLFLCLQRDKQAILIIRQEAKRFITAKMQAKYAHKLGIKINAVLKIQVRNCINFLM